MPVNFPADASSAQVLAATKNITADNKAADETPLYSPDGKYIAYRAQARPGDESDRWGLMLYERKTREKRNLTEDFDFWVGSYVWEPDSSVIDFSAEDAGSSPIYSVSLSGGLHGLARGYNDDLTITHDGTQILFTKMSIQAPIEIYAASTARLIALDCGIPKGAKNPLLNCFQDPQPITRINDSVLSQVSLSSLESFSFAGANKDKVQGFLVKPPNFDSSKKYPVKFLIHGGPEGAWGDDWSYRWNPELFAANGYVVIMINFHGSTGYGQKFVDAINGDWGGAPFEDLMKGLDYAERIILSSTRRGSARWAPATADTWPTGFLATPTALSASCRTMACSTPSLAGARLRNYGFTNGSSRARHTPIAKCTGNGRQHFVAANFKTPTLVIHNQLDYRLDVSQGFDLFTTLQRQGVPSKMLYFPDEGHFVLKPQNSQLWYKTVNDWVDEWRSGQGQ